MSIDSTSIHQPQESFSSRLSSDSIRPTERSTSDLPQQTHPRSLEEFRKSEGRENRKRRLQALWNRLPPLPQPRGCTSNDSAPKPLGPGGLTYERAESIRAMYDDELLVRCRGSKDRSGTQRVKWDEFKEYAQAKEVGKSIHSLPLLLITMRRTLACFPGVRFGSQWAIRRRRAPLCPLQIWYVIPTLPYLSAKSQDLQSISHRICPLRNPSIT